MRAKTWWEKLVDLLMGWLKKKQPDLPVPTPDPTPVEEGQYVSEWALDPVPGSEADKGQEIVGFIGGADYRFLGNDSKGEGYFLSGIVEQAEAFGWKKVGEVWEVWAKDFTSSKSGLKYKWVGFRIQKSANPMQTKNPLKIPVAEMKGSFRTYWQTVSGKLM